MQYIYLIRTGEFAQDDEPTYKIGKTTQPINDRLSKYPPNIEIHYVQSVQNCHDIKRLIIDRFKQLFIHRTDCGNAYFTGSLNVMMETIHDATEMYDLEQANTSK